MAIRRHAAGVAEEVKAFHQIWRSWTWFRIRSDIDKIRIQPLRTNRIWIQPLRTIRIRIQPQDNPDPYPTSQDPDPEML